MVFQGWSWEPHASRSDGKLITSPDFWVRAERFCVGFSGRAELESSVFSIYVLFCLAVLSLSRNMQGLSLWRAASVVVAHGSGCPTACGILVLRPGIEPVSPALGRRLPEAPRKSLKSVFNKFSLKYERHWSMKQIPSWKTAFHYHLTRRTRPFTCRGLSCLSFLPSTCSRRAALCVTRSTCQALPLVCPHGLGHRLTAPFVGYLAPAKFNKCYLFIPCQVRISLRWH